MLMCGDLRAGALGLVAAALCACSTQGAPTETPSLSSSAQSPAADLRTHLDLLMSEQVMIVAKETNAAVAHSDEYTAYASLLAPNAADIVTLLSRAFGNTAGEQFAQVWSMQNGLLVDYAIGVVTHNDDKAKVALAGLNEKFSVEFGQLLQNLTHLPASVITQLTAHQIALEKAFIDAFFGGDFTTAYLQLNYAYFWIDRIGDVIAEQITALFPDRYPGDVVATAVDARLQVNEVLQQHAYLVTMATDATVNGRAGEKAAALVGLATNAQSMRSEIDDQRFAMAWSREYGALIDYALKGDAASREAVAKTSAAELAGVMSKAATNISDHEDASLKVVDDQRSKASSVADDDRAAATSMQPIADSVE